MAMNDDFSFDIDSILSDFTAETDFAAAPSTAVNEPTEDIKAPAKKQQPQRDILKEKTAVFETVPAKTDLPKPQEEKTTHYAEKYRKPAIKAAPAKKAAASKEPEISAEKPKAKKFKASKPEKAPKASKETRERPSREKKERIPLAERLPRGLVKSVSIVLVMAMLAFVLDFVNPSAGSAASMKTADKAADFASNINTYATAKTRAAALHALTETEATLPPEVTMPTKTVYKIDSNALVAPAPLSNAFGRVSTSDAAEILNVIQRARESGLLGEDETVVFDPNVEFNNGSYYQDIQYYLDDTLLVIAWKEIIDGNTCTFCEVKMQDASQFRRKLAGDTFGSDILEYTTTMHAATNAVVSMNADYYRFRDMGIVVFDHQLYRFNEGEYLLRYGQMLRKYNCIDTLFVTTEGDFLFWHLYEESTPEDMQRFIEENNILFSIAFGPVLVENGELNTSYFEEQWYPIGEINTGYSRAGIGQMGKYHYLYMSLNHSDEKAARWPMKEFAQHFYEKGVVNAYALDGGQTSEIVFQGDEAYNHVDHVNGTSSRQVSDMIYFASAINGEEVLQ